MKIYRIAKPGKIMKQPPKDPNSGKMDSQIFISKEDPQHPSKKKKKKKTSNSNSNSNDNITLEAKLAASWEYIESLGLNDKQLVDIFMGFAEKTRGTYEGLYTGASSNYTPQINLLNRAILMALPITDASTGLEIKAPPESIKKAAENIRIALNGIDVVDEAFLTASGNKTITRESMTSRDLIVQQINNAPQALVLKAIKAIGEVSIAGFSGVTLDDIDAILPLCDDYELKEIINIVNDMNTKSNQPELNLASKKTMAGKDSGVAIVKFEMNGKINATMISCSLSRDTKETIKNHFLSSHKGAKILSIKIVSDDNRPTEEEMKEIKKNSPKN